MPQLINYAKAQQLGIGVHRISDFSSMRQFHRTNLYNECYRRVNMQFQIAFELPLSKGGISAYALSRSHRDFTERDRTLLILMKPRLFQTRQKLMERIRFRQALR